MSYIEIILLALALSVDACVVSFSYGLVFNKNRLRNALALAFFTGMFQGLMPCLGYYLTSIIKNYIASYANLIVFAIFVYLGIKFIIEAIHKKNTAPVCISIGCLFLIGIATSIDAFSAGISLSLYGNHILKPAILIALVTFINSCLGFMLGGRLKSMPSNYFEILAGVILVVLGVKALL